MNASIRVRCGLGLSALLIACLSCKGLVEANSGNSAQKQNELAVASRLVVPLRPEWRLGSPISHRNLTVFPVITDNPSIGADLITLDQGLRSGKVIITELGADGRSRRVNPQRISDDAEVNRLALTNRSGKALVLLAGELIVGGQQDRIVGHDCIIEASNKPVPLDVFCVEHGRWSGGSTFGEELAVGSSRRGSGRNSGVGPGDGGGAGPGSGHRNNMTIAVMPGLAAPNIREKAQASKSQTEVWAAVSEQVTVVDAETSTGTLTSVYRDKRNNARVASFERAFRGKLVSTNIVGVVIAVGDKITSTDVFANHSLFRAYWPKMLKSYALEAVSSPRAGVKQASRSDAEAFLARVQGEGSESRKDAYRLSENQSSRHVSFELEDTRAKPTLIHFNRIAKK